MNQFMSKGHIDPSDGCAIIVAQRIVIHLEASLVAISGRGRSRGRGRGRGRGRRVDGSRSRGRSRGGRA